MAYLFVPDFHKNGISANSSQFKEWLDSVSFSNPEWFLHGYYHLETENNSLEKGGANFFKRKFMTAGEGEFLSLSEEEIKKRIEKGMEVMNNALPGINALGFIAPAWLYNENLFPVLRKMGLKLSESHWGIYNTETSTGWRAPVVTWATRTLVRKYGSLLVCPYLEKKHKDQTWLRIAIHPHDFKHPETVKNIRFVINSALSHRETSSYKDFLKELPLEN